MAFGFQVELMHSLSGACAPFGLLVVHSAVPARVQGLITPPLVVACQPGSCAVPEFAFKHAFRCCCMPCKRAARARGCPA
jgi:hypothetical protein